MTDPSDKVTGVILQKITEDTVAVDDSPVVNIDTAGSEKIELVNKGPNSVYFRLDGTTPTPGAAGNSDMLASGVWTCIDGAKITDVKLICSTGETATVFYRLHT